MTKIELPKDALRAIALTVFMPISVIEIITEELDVKVTMVDIIDRKIVMDVFIMKESDKLKIG